MVAGPTVKTPIKRTMYGIKLLSLRHGKRARTHTHTHTHTHTYTHKHTHTSRHKHTHTHKQAGTHKHMGHTVRKILPVYYLERNINYCKRFVMCDLFSLMTSVTKAVTIVSRFVNRSTEVQPLCVMRFKKIRRIVADLL